MSQVWPMDPNIGRTTYDRRHDIDSTRAPRIVFYGDSHIGHLYQWSKNIDTSGSPWQLERKVLSDSKYIYSGGSKWTNVHTRVQGIDTPVWQRQGNIWKRVMEDIENSNYETEYLYISCFGNDLDLINSHRNYRRTVGPGQ